jgi:hypothetical protein
VASLRKFSRSFLSLSLNLSRNNQDKLQQRHSSFALPPLPLESSASGAGGGAEGGRQEQQRQQQHQHHHPGERPGADAMEMLNDPHPQTLATSSAIASAAPLQSHSTLLEDEVKLSSLSH